MSAATPVPRFTVDQAVIVSAYTGVLCCDVSILQRGIEERLGRLVWLDEIPLIGPELKQAFEPDFLRLCRQSDALPCEKDGTL